TVENDIQVLIGPSCSMLMLFEMISSRDVNFFEDWKLLTIFIGANNECGACHYPSTSMPEYFEEQLRNTLNLVEQTLPRTFVNLITIFNISGVWYAGRECVS